MANYYYDSQKQKAWKRRQKLRRLLLILLLAVLIIVAGIYIWKSANSGFSGPVVIKPPTKSYYAGAPNRVFESDRFKFVSSDNWQYSPEESLGVAKYVYFTHSLNNNLVEFELDILFDKSLDGQAVNYIMPVTEVNNKLKTDSLSPRCGEKTVTDTPSAAPNTLAMEFHGAKYICLVRGSTEKAAAAMVGGSYDISLKTPSGQTVVVNLSFVNNSSSYFGSAFKQVLESFQLK